MAWKDNVTRYVTAHCYSRCLIMNARVHKTISLLLLRLSQMSEACTNSSYKHGRYG